LIIMQNQNNTDIATDLRNQIAALEGHQIELVAERDELSYSALVDRKPDAIKRLTAVNGELANITAQTASLTAALREAGKREAAAMEEARTERRAQDARQAADILIDVQALADKLTSAMQSLRDDAIAIEGKLGEIRRLGVYAPSVEAIRSRLRRTLTTALMGSALQTGHLAPSERIDVAGAVGEWSRSITASIDAATGEKPAKAA
jgi:chromosome segregation ATPase